MAKHKWILLRIAADMLSDPQQTTGPLISACSRIERAARLGTVKVRGWKPQGVRSDIPPEGVLVEIEADELAGLRLDCRRSRAVLDVRTRQHVPIYERVEVRLADIERLGRDGDEGAAQEPQLSGTPSETPSEAQKAGRLMQAVASQLRRVYPDGDPGMRGEELKSHLRKAAGEKLGVFSLTTLKRAIRLAWPPAPKRAKAGQPSR